MTVFPKRYVAKATAQWENDTCLSCYYRGMVSGTQRTVHYIHRHIHVVFCFKNPFFHSVI